MIKLFQEFKTIIHINQDSRIYRKNEEMIIYRPDNQKFLSPVETEAKADEGKKLGKSVDEL